MFFVISGFLITGWLLRRFSTSGRVPFTQFYAARARRILAASTLTLVVTVVVAWHYLNYIRAVSVFHDAIWATLFAANVHFAEVGTNYFAQDNPPSPLQNFWTLAVEEPVLHRVASAFGTRAVRRPRPPHAPDIPVERRRLASSDSVSTTPAIRSARTSRPSLGAGSSGWEP